MLTPFRAARPRSRLLLGTSGLAFTAGAAFFMANSLRTTQEEKSTQSKDDDVFAGWTDEEDDAPGKLSLIGHVVGVWDRFNRWINSFLPEVNKTPAIPDPLPPQYRPPFVLVMDLEVLVAVEFEPGRGWRTRKRPGVDYFLSNARQCFEIIVFSSKVNNLAGFNIVQKMDVEQAITYKFFDNYKKDVLALNRPLEKTVVLTVDPSEYPEEVQPNCLQVPATSKSDGDSTLLDLSIFVAELKANARKIPDVRSVVNKLNTMDRPMLEVYHEKSMKQLEAKENMLGGKKGFLK